MRIIQRYITVNLIAVTFVALFGLVALFSFFSIVDQLEETGKGTYGVTQALLYVLLTTPKLAYELFPIASVVGSMTALGILAQNSELAVIRTSGVSKFTLAVSLARSGALLVILAVIIGEFVAPISEKTAQQMRSMAISDQITTQSRFGIWARDGNSYVNIRKASPDDKVEEIYIYEFDDADQLRSTISAKQGEYTGEDWILKDLQQTSISVDGVSKKDIDLASWDSLFKPEMVEFILIKPQYMTVWGLYRYIDYLKLNAQDTLMYEQAFWTKLIKPFSIIAMILLAIPLVNSHARFVSVGQRVFIGALTGILFHIGNQTAGHMGIVYQINPVISVTMPTILLLMVIAFLLKRPG